MCDALSLASAGTSILDGLAQGNMAQAQADFEAGQYKILGIMAEARGADQIAGLRLDYAEARMANEAAAAVSGLARESFEAVRKGNKKDLDKNISRVKKNVAADVAEMAGRARVAKIEGRHKKAVAINAGLFAAADTLVSADDAYLANRLPAADGSDRPESRWEYLQRSWRAPWTGGLRE